MGHVVEIVSKSEGKGVEDGGRSSEAVFGGSEKTGGRDEDAGLLFRSSKKGRETNRMGWT